MKHWELGNRIVSVFLMLTIQMTANILDESLHEVFGNLSVLSHKSLDACAVSPDPSFAPHASVSDNENNTTSAAATGSGMSALERAKRRTPVRVVSVDSSKVNHFPCLAAVATICFSARNILPPTTECLDHDGGGLARRGEWPQPRGAVLLQVRVFGAAGTVPTAPCANGATSLQKVTTTAFRGLRLGCRVIMPARATVDTRTALTAWTST
jgi:hypothetical protein